MEEAFDFSELFILDLANNHQGSVEHGRTIIRSAATVIARHGVRAALKFQFRQLDTFIHPHYRAQSEYKHLQRFLSTRLEKEQFQVLLDEVRTHGLLAMCTPFDEESVGICIDMGFDALKVASCSAKDWPLLEEIASAGKPIVCSTGGLTIEDIDNLVSFFQHRGAHFAMMHCVSVYPTPDDLMNLNQIRLLRSRYPTVPIGWSTHENPDDTLPVQMAVALGAELFERHVGVETEGVQRNAYSSTPAQLDEWLTAYVRAKRLCGPAERPPVSAAEEASLEALQRGIYAKQLIKQGTEIERDQVYFAMPYEEGQLQSGQWRAGIVASVDISIDEPVRSSSVRISADEEVMIIKKAVHEVKALLNQAQIHLGSEFKVEYSHHYGIANFRQTGAVFIECMNREYCKKLVIQLPGQRHPSHYHAQKEETFQVLHGVLHVTADDYHRALHPGETILVQPGVWHSFWTDTGVIFEEVSTTHYKNDSFYADKQINKLRPSERKTIVDHWGRFQLAPTRARE